MKKISYYMQVVLVLLCLETVLAYRFDVLRDLDIERFIKEKEKIESSIENITTKSKLYVRSIKPPKESVIRYVYIMLTTFEEHKSLSEKEWRKQMASFCKHPRNYSDMKLRISIEHRKVGLSGLQEEEEVLDKKLTENIQEKIRETLRDIERHKKNREISEEIVKKKVAEIIRKIREKKAKHVDFSRFIKVFVDKISRRGYSRSFEICIPYEIFFFCNAQKLISLIKTYAKSCFLFIEVSSSSNILYDAEEKKIYKLADSTKPEAYSHWIDVEKKTYLIVQRKEETYSRIYYRKGTSVSDAEKKYIPKTILIKHTRKETDILPEKVALSYVPKGFLVCASDKEEKVTVDFKTNFNCREESPIHILYIPCTFFEDKNGNFVINNISLSLEGVQTSIIRLTRENPKDSIPIEVPSFSLRHYTSPSLYKNSSFTRRENKYRKNKNFPKHATLNTLEIDNHHHLGELVLEKPHSIKVEKLRFKNDITPLCTKEANFNGSLLSFITQHLTFQEELIFEISPAQYINNVINNTYFTLFSLTKERKIQAVMKDLEKWTHRENPINKNLIFHITKKDLETENNNSYFFSQSQRQNMSCSIV